MDIILEKKIFGIRCQIQILHVYQLAAEKKYSKNGAAGIFFCPSYYVTALARKKKETVN